MRAAWKKVGTFSIHTCPAEAGRTTKSGGNVMTYFCTPQLHVIHAIPGNVEADEFIREARWALELADRLAALAPTARPAAAGQEHATGVHMHKLPSWGATHTQTGLLLRAHDKLARQPLPSLGLVSKYFFEEMLKEKLSDNPVERRIDVCWIEINATLD